MQNQLESLFFIAVVPPEDIQRKVLILKEEIRQMWGCKHAFNSPPHITLHMPFRLNPKKLEALYGNMEKLALRQDVFPVELNGMGCFEPRVVYVDVMPNEKLEQLHGQIKKEMHGLQVFNAEYKNQGFHPHVTLAFRDLKKSDFPAVWQHISTKKISENFPVHSFQLLKHVNNQWKIFAEFKFRQLI